MRWSSISALCCWRSSPSCTRTFIGSPRCGRLAAGWGDLEQESAMPRIGYDVTPLIGMSTGVGNYTRQLLAHMLAAGDEYGFLLLSNRHEAVRDLPVSTRLWPLIQPMPSRMVWMQSVLPATLRTTKPDLCHY